MQEVIKKVIDEMRTRLNDEIEQSHWYNRKFREAEAKILSMKEAIATLQQTLNGPDHHKE